MFPKIIFSWRWVKFVIYGDPIFCLLVTKIIVHLIAYRQLKDTVFSLSNRSSTINFRSLQISVKNQKICLHAIIWTSGQGKKLVEFLLQLNIDSRILTSFVSSIILCSAESMELWFGCIWNWWFMVPSRWVSYSCSFELTFWMLSTSVTSLDNSISFLKFFKFFSHFKKNVYTVSTICWSSKFASTSIHLSNSNEELSTLSSC